MTDTLVDADRAVATDTSLLLNFLRIERTNILGALPGFRFYVLNHVVNEVIQTPRLALADGT